MRKFIQLDESGFVVGTSFSDLPPPGLFVEVDEFPGLTASSTKVKWNGSSYEDTGESWIQHDYKMKRHLEYPEIGSQLDAIWKAISPLIDHPEAAKILSQIQAVKAAYPKS